MCFAPVLTYFQAEMNGIHHVDVSDIAIGAVLAQEHSDGVRPLVLAYRKLLDSESGFPQQEKNF